MGRGYAHEVTTESDAAHDRRRGGDSWGVAAGRLVKRVAARIGVAKSDVAPSPDLVDPPPAPGARNRRVTLANPAQQAAFERDGYVVVDLADTAAVAELWGCYEDLDHATHEDWPWVDGFETSLYDPRPAYREQILHDAERVLGPALDRVLVDYRVMFANWLVKVPHAAEVPLHADWTFLDESRFSSVTVWCPLADTSVALGNGPLGVVVGSQLQIDFLRVANVAAYDRCEQAVEGLERAVPDLRAGQAIVMDNRVVHFSPPNLTDRARLALGCVVGPVEADLHHYWLHDDGRLLRFELDRSFYLNYTIGQPEAADGIVDVVEVDDHAAAHSLR